MKKSMIKNKSINELLEADYQINFHHTQSTLSIIVTGFNHKISEAI